jgi:hypothetical protein
VTNERDKEDMDAVVSKTYRELGGLRAPDHLNEAILRMAAGKSGSKGSMLFAAWLKPVALAATIGLTLAIVLELSAVPTVSVPMEVAPTPESTRADKPSLPADILAEERVLGNVARLRGEAKSKSDSYAAAAPAATSFARPAEELGSDATIACEPSERQSADVWLECIEKLRKSGAIEDAEREYEAFLLQYPAE